MLEQKRTARILYNEDASLGQYDEAYSHKPQVQELIGIGHALYFRAYSPKRSIIQYSATKGPAYHSVSNVHKTILYKSLVVEKGTT